jgi:hypothetical protein
MKIESVFTVLPALLGFTCGAALAAQACTGTEPAQTAADISAVRQVVCGYALLHEAASPQMQQIAKLCRAGAALEPIAAAYAGCAAPVGSAQQADASGAVDVVDPWPDAGTD